jgi:hypothetical protein
MFPLFILLGFNWRKYWYGAKFLLILDPRDFAVEGKVFTVCGASGIKAFDLRSRNGVRLG